MCGCLKLLGGGWLIMCFGGALVSYLTGFASGSASQTKDPPQWLVDVKSTPPHGAVEIELRAHLPILSRNFSTVYLFDGGIRNCGFVLNRSFSLCGRYGMGRLSWCGEFGWDFQEPIDHMVVSSQQERRKPTYNESLFFTCNNKWSSGRAILCLKCLMDWLIWIILLCPFVRIIVCLYAFYSSFCFSLFSYPVRIINVNVNVLFSPVVSKCFPAFSGAEQN